METALTCNNYQLALKEVNGQRVVTFKDVDKVHARSEGTASRNFRENKDYFIENEDFYSVKPATFQNDEFRLSGFSSEDVNNRGTIFLTEFGYLLLVKSLTDKLAWKIQRQLINSYFRAKNPPPQQSSTPQLEQSIMSLQTAQQHIIDCAMEQSSQLQDHEEQLESIQRCLQYDLLHADKMDEISSEFSRLEEEIAELKNGISCKQVEAPQETRKSLNRPATAVEIAGVIMQPLIEKFDDHSSGGCATYRKVYEAMGVSWKYRTTKYMNEHELKVVPKKLEMIVNDRKLRTLFTKAIEKLLQEN